MRNLLRASPTMLAAFLLVSVGLLFAPSNNNNNVQTTNRWFRILPVSANFTTQAPSSENNNNVTCSAATTCRSCAKSTSCGFCTSSRNNGQRGMCMSGSFGGSYETDTESGSCTGSNWTWFAEECGASTSIQMKLSGLSWSMVLDRNRTLVLTRLRAIFATRLNVPEERVWIISLSIGSLLVDAEVLSNELTGAVVAPLVAQASLQSADLSSLQELYSSTTGTTSEDPIVVQSVSASSSSSNQKSGDCDSAACRGMLAGVILAGIFVVMALGMLMCCYCCCPPASQNGGGSTRQDGQKKEEEEGNMAARTTAAERSYYDVNGMASSSRQQGYSHYDYNRPAPTKIHSGMTIAQQRQAQQQQRQQQQQQQYQPTYSYPPSSDGYGSQQRTQQQQQLQQSPQQQQSGARLRAFAMEPYSA